MKRQNNTITLRFICGGDTISSKQGLLLPLSMGKNNRCFPLPSENKSV